MHVTSNRTDFILKEHFPLVFYTKYFSLQVISRSVLNLLGPYGAHTLSMSSCCMCLQLSVDVLFFWEVLWECSRCTPPPAPVWLLGPFICLHYVPTVS